MNTNDHSSAPLSHFHSHGGAAFSQQGAPAAFAPPPPPPPQKQMALMNQHMETIAPSAAPVVPPPAVGEPAALPPPHGQVPSSTSRNLYVSSLPLKFTVEQFRALAEPYGTILDVRFFSNTKAARTTTRGYGFVLYDTPEAAQRALKGLQGLQVDDRRLQCHLRSHPSETVPSVPQSYSNLYHLHHPGTFPPYAPLPVLNHPGPAAAASILPPAGGGGVAPPVSDPVATQAWLGAWAAAGAAAGAAAAGAGVLPSQPHPVAPYPHPSSYYAPYTTSQTLPLPPLEAPLPPQVLPNATWASQPGAPPLLVPPPPPPPPPPPATTPAGTLWPYSAYPPPPPPSHNMPSSA